LRWKAQAQSRSPGTAELATRQDVVMVVVVASPVNRESSAAGVCALAKAAQQQRVTAAQVAGDEANWPRNLTSTPVSARRRSRGSRSLARR
jgi:hypothetical protein